MATRVVAANPLSCRACRGLPGAGRRRALRSALRASAAAQAARRPGRCWPPPLRCPPAGRPLPPSRLRCPWPPWPCRLVVQPQGQRDALARDVDVEHLDPHDVAGLTTSRGSLTKVCDMRRHVHQAVLVHADVDERAERGHVGDHALQQHARAEVASFSTPSAKVAVLNAGRGSRPGFSSSLRMSVTVGRPNVSSTNCCRLERRAAPRCCRSASSGRRRWRRRMRRTTGYASGCTLEASSGSSPSGMRRKPAHCSNAFGPEPGHAP